MYIYGLILIVSSVLLFRLLRVGRRPAGLPPGPPTIPILGNVHLMPDRDLHLQFEQWAKEYGPVYSLILGTKTMIVLSSDKAVVDLFDKRGAIYSSRADHYLGSDILSQGNRMVMMKYGSRVSRLMGKAFRDIRLITPPRYQWRMLRRVIHGLLNQVKSASYVPYQDLESKQMLFEMLTHPDRFLDSVRRFAMSLTSSMVYGVRTDSFDDPVMEKLFENTDVLTEIVQSASGQLLEVFPILRRLPDFLFPIRENARRSHRKEKELFRSLYLRVKDSQEKAKRCLSVDMARAQEKEGFSDDLAAYTVGSVLEAGADTTSNTLYGFVQAMVLFPEVQHRAQQEIDEIVGGDRLPTLDDYARLPYVRGCVKESTRWMPTAVLGFPHAVMEDDEYNGFKIPKGAQVVSNVWAIAMDPKRHPDAHRFDPGRFTDNRLNLVDSITHADPAVRPTFVFGAGRRVCQGMHVAENSLFLGIARMLWAFNIAPAKGSDGQDTMPDPSRLTQGFVCRPDDYLASITPRSTKKAQTVHETWTEAQKDLDPDSRQWQ